MKQHSERYWVIIRYSILTVALFLPLFWSFRYVRNLYPITVWNVMMAGGDLGSDRSYCVLRGETISGEPIDIRPVGLTNAMSQRTWGMVNAAVSNQSFKLSSIHPDNALLLEHYGGIEQLPPGARMPDLLSTWGKLYNDQQSTSSPHRLKAIRIDMYRWASGRYADYETFVTSWRKEL
jgi:hypothetical protein